jgi:hypothetical protein
MLSFPENIPTVLNAVRENAKHRILDAGPGFGKYGILIREQYLSLKAEAGEIIPADDLVIDCAEITDFFLNRPSLENIYNQVIRKDIWTWTPEELGEYELIILSDFVEHWPKKIVLDWLAQCPTKVLISTPIKTYMFDEHFYGDSHTHITQWTLQDFSGFHFKNYSNQMSYIIVIHGSKNTVTQ